jgi:hypothetical protein
MLITTPLSDGKAVGMNLRRYKSLFILRPKSIPQYYKKTKRSYIQRGGTIMAVIDQTNN